MKINVEHLPQCQAKLSVEVPGDAVSGARANIVKEISRAAKLPGFRPGKVPAKVVEQRFSEEIENRLSDQLVREACQTGIKENDLSVLSVDTVDDTLYHDDGTFSCTVHITTRPSFELPEYKGIELKVPAVQVTDDDVEQTIARFREQFADYNKVGDRPVQKGDVAVIDYKGTIDGQPVGEVLPSAGASLAQSHEYWMKVEDGMFLPGFTDALVGANEGDELTINVTLPDDFPLEDGRGREVVYAVNVKSVMEPKLPELDDAFANSVEPGTTIDGLRDRLRERIGDEKESRVEDIKRNQVMSHLARLVDFELPAEVVKNETQAEVNRMVERGQEAGMEDEQIREKQDEIFNAASGTAHQNVKIKFILAEIANKEEIKVSDSELANHIAAIAQASSTPMKKLVARLKEGDRIGGIRERLLFGKVVDFLVAEASVEEVNEPEGAPAGGDAAQ